MSRSRPRLRLAALSLPLLAVAVATTGDDRRGVTLYGDAGFRGTNQSFYDDVPDLGRTSFGNDRASSVVVARGCRARLYADTGFRGARVELNGDASNLSRTPVGNDRVSSLKVRCGWAQDWGPEGPGDGYGGHGGHGDGYGHDGYGQGHDGYGHDGYGQGHDGYGHGHGGYDQGGHGGPVGAVLFRDARYRGRQAGFRSGDYPNLRETALGNDAVSSIELRRGCRARLFTDVDFRGEYEELRHDVPDLRGTRIGNDRASSLQVRCGGRWGWTHGGRRGGVVLFEHARFDGFGERFEYDVPDLRATELGNDRASSIAVDRGCRVRLYEDVGFRGRSIELRGDEAYLGQTPIGNDRVSSLEVRCRY